MICIKCGRDLPEEDFPMNSYRDKNNNIIHKRRSVCKDCYKIQQNTWKSNNKDKINQYAAKYRNANREKIRELCKNRYHSNPEVRARQAERQKMLPRERRKSCSARSKYKLTIDEYLALPKACEICGGTEKLSIDHDHVTGKVRGVLCYRCNVALGFIAEDENRAIGLAHYIKERCKEK